MLTEERKTSLPSSFLPFFLPPKIGGKSSRLLSLLLLVSFLSPLLSYPLFSFLHLSFYPSCQLENSRTGELKFFFSSSPSLFLFSPCLLLLSPANWLARWLANWRPQENSDSSFPGKNWSFWRNPFTSKSKIKRGNSTDRSDDATEQQVLDRIRKERTKSEVDRQGFFSFSL